MVRLLSLFACLAISYGLGASAQAAIVLPNGVEATKAWRFSFEDYQESTGDVAPDDQVQLYVFESEAPLYTGKINFLFTNTGGQPCNVCEIWFSDGAYLAPPINIVSSSGVTYTTYKETWTDSPPQMNEPWTTTAYAGVPEDLSPERMKQGGVSNGIDQVDEWLVISYTNKRTFEAVIDGLTGGTETNPLFRIAIHVQTLETNAGSDTWTLGDGFDAAPPVDPVPEPAMLSLWGLGGLISLLTFYRRRARLM